MDSEDANLEFMEASLLVLNRDELIKIMENLDAQTIGRLCSVSKRFSEICSDPSFWRRLIRSQFPNEPFEGDPREQYIELSDTRVTTYYLMGEASGHQTTLEDHEGNVVELTFLPKASLEDHDEIWLSRDQDYLQGNYPEEVGDFSFPFDIRGGPRRDGTKIWIVVKEGEYEIDIKAYKKREDAILDAAEIIMAELSPYEEEYSGIFERVYGMSLTIENIRNYLNKYSFLHFREVNENDEMITIMEVELYHESPYFKDFPRVE